MKNIILKSFACLLLLSLTWSCSDEGDVSTQPVEKQVQTKNGSLLDGIIATLRDGKYEIIVDEQQLIEELETVLEEETGEPIELSSVSIQQKTATNDPTNSSYFLIGNTVDLGDDTVSFGGRLDASSGGLFFSSSSRGKFLGCKGCGTGCFIEYYFYEGKYFPYCDSAGCGRRCARYYEKS